MRLLVISLMTVFLFACTGKPESVTPVKGFDVQQYLGKWYEIARLDHGFEEGLSQVNAEYSLRDDGGIDVINRGYSVEANEWTQAEGKAFFVETPDIGYLKVSFFGPFYGSYIIFGLDKNYQHAYISGPNHDYLWLLSRTPTVSDEVKADFIAKAKAAGFDTTNLIYVEQDAE
ncbi:hypothetical protein LCGC14_0847200 [marine sediment metagenome]|uniref:Lipocalin/cytosolic fatty-acid binding domain-containing protein n=1 Tax=marine sediment metagenome TaxID=412755 RepID=A0A0F9RW73_9ZZZZ